VLDSWVRFEQQAKENEQAELAKSIIAKVLSTVRDEKTQREILNGAVAEVERKYRFSYILRISVAEWSCRTC
jgi:F-type H+-transporting ATPase subunit b